QQRRPADLGGHRNRRRGRLRGGAATELELEPAKRLRAGRRPVFARSRSHPPARPAPGRGRTAMRPALAYRYRPGPLGDGGALAASAYCAALALAALVSADPIVLAGCGIAVGVAGMLSGARRALGVALRWSLGFGVLIILVNGITSQRGDTVLVHGI